MSAAREEVCRWVHSFLNVGAFQDYAPNGLQVEGAAELRRIVTGVSANMALIDEAIARSADALVVHHGFFWRNEDRRITGYRRQRIGALLAADVNLMAYHLPLDAHGEVGNNVQILRGLGASALSTFGGEPHIGWVGELAEESSASVVARLREFLGAEGTVFLVPDRPVRRIGVVSGGGAGFFEEAVALGCDLFITGEPSEQSQGLARELGVSFAAMGHHATERLGVQALGARLEEQFGVEVSFVDVPNPV